MKLHRVLLAGVMAALASEASATRYAFCTISGLYNVHMVTGIIEIGEEDAAFTALDSGPWPVEFAEAFIERNGNRPQIQGCHYENSMRLVEDYWQQQEYYAREGGYKFIRTGWLGGKPAAVDRGDPDKRSQKGLMLVVPGSKVSSGASPGNSAAALANRARDDAAVLEAQKAAAAVNAKRVADAARNTEAMKVQLARLKEEMKKRGSAQ